MTDPETTTPPAGDNLPAGGEKPEAAKPDKAGRTTVPRKLPTPWQYTPTAFEPVHNEHTTESETTQ